MFLRLDLLIGRLANFDFEGFGVFFPATLREFIFYLGDGGEGGGFLAEFIFGVGFPIKRYVGLRAI